MRSFHRLFSPLFSSPLSFRILIHNKRNTRQKLFVCEYFFFSLFGVLFGLVSARSASLCIFFSSRKSIQALQQQKKIMEKNYSNINHISTQKPISYSFSTMICAAGRVSFHSEFFFCCVSLPILAAFFQCDQIPFVGISFCRSFVFNTLWLLYGGAMIILFYFLNIFHVIQFSSMGIFFVCVKYVSNLNLAQFHYVCLCICSLRCRVVAFVIQFCVVRAATFLHTVFFFLSFIYFIFARLLRFASFQILPGNRFDCCWFLRFVCCCISFFEIRLTVVDRFP